MTKISYLEALENPRLRQKYLDYLVESSGLNFPYVDEFKYITNEEAGKIKDRLCHFSEDSENELEKITAACIPNGKIPANSTIYFTENNFSNDCKKILTNLLVTQNDFETAHRIEIYYHEAVHSEHFCKGINGFNLKEFKLETEEGKKLFIIASEIDAHKKHILALGNTKSSSFYLSQYQKFLISVFTNYIRLLPQLVKEGFDENLSRKIFDKYKELRYNQLQN